MSSITFVDGIIAVPKLCQGYVESQAHAGGSFLFGKNHGKIAPAEVLCIGPTQPINGYCSTKSLCQAIVE